MVAWLDNGESPLNIFFFSKNIIKPPILISFHRMRVCQTISGPSWARPIPPARTIKSIQIYSSSLQSHDVLQSKQNATRHISCDKTSSSFLGYTLLFSFQFFIFTKFALYIHKTMFARSRTMNACFLVNASTVGV